MHVGVNAPFLIYVLGEGILSKLSTRLPPTVSDCNRTVLKYSKFSPIRHYRRINHTGLCRMEAASVGEGT